MAEAVVARPLGWTVDTLLEYTNVRVAAVVDQILAQGKMLDERYETQTKATEAARLTQEVAMQTALSAAKVLSDAAAKAQATAIDKAETANDKRFAALSEKLTTDNDTTGERLREMENRLLTQMSRQTGSNDEVVVRRLVNAERRGNVMMLAAFCAIAVSIVSVFVH